MLDAQLFLRSQLVSGNTICFIACSMINYIFGLSSYLAIHPVFLYARCSTISSVSARIWQYTLFFLHILDAQLFLQSQLLSDNTHGFIACSMLNHIFSLSSYLAIHTVFSSHSRCSTISSVSARNWQHTLLYHTLDSQMFTRPQCLTQSEPGRKSQSLTQSLKHMKEVTHRKIICHSRRR